MAYKEQEKLIRHCCHIPCDKLAMWEINNTTPGVDPYDFTDACNDHVGELLGDGREYTLVRIN